MEEIAGILSKKIESPIKIEKKEKKLILRIETDEYDPCKAKNVPKKTLFGLKNRIFVVHVDDSGNITYEELK
ncbi:MAG: hypothetical protein KAT49_05370 [Methanomicrobia archaeon]|nr:hypothetical protein [Methanomicrobia archaeon]